MAKGLEKAMLNNILYGLLILAIALISGVLGYWIGYGKKHTYIDAAIGLFTNLDNYILVLSVIVIFISIICSINQENSNTIVIVLNMFSCVIFSWLLTKKSSKKEFKEKEEELALKSYRHINYIETAADTASKTIEKHMMECGDVDENTRLVMLNAKSQITYIQGGINTCKMDWFDLLSREEQENHSTKRIDSEEYGTYDTVVTDVNQEEA